MKKGDPKVASSSLSPTRSLSHHNMSRDLVSRNPDDELLSSEETVMTTPKIQPTKHISRIIKIVPDLIPEESGGLKSSSFVLQDFREKESRSSSFVEEKSSRSSSLREEKSTREEKRREEKICAGVEKICGGVEKICGGIDDRTPTKDPGKFLRVNSNVLGHLHLNHIWLKECK